MKITEHLAKIDEMLEKRKQEEKKKQLFDSPTPDFSVFPTKQSDADISDPMNIL